MNKYLLVGLVVALVLGVAGLYVYFTHEPVTDDAVVQNVLQPQVVREERVKETVLPEERPSLQVLTVSSKTISFSYSNMPLAHIQLIKKSEEPNVTGGADRIGIGASEKAYTEEWALDSGIPAGTYILRAMKWDPVEGDPDAVLFETNEFYFPGS